LPARDFRPSHDRPTNRPTTGPLDPDQVSMFRTREMRLGLAVLSTPGTAVSTRPKSIFDRRLPPLNGQSLPPCPATRRQGVRLTRHQPRIHCRSAHAQPSPHLWPPDGTGVLGLYPELRTRLGRTQPRTSGQGQASTPARTTSPISTDPPPTYSLNTCGITSHCSQQQCRTP